MADVIITSVFSIVSALCSCSTGNNRCFYLLDLQENREALNNALMELKATRDGVKIRVDEKENNPDQKRTPEVDNWLQRAEKIEGEVGEILKKVDQEIKGRCFGGKFPKNCWRAGKIGKLVIKEVGIVEGHKSKGDSFVGNDVAVTLRVLPPLAQSEPMNTTVGMEFMFDKVWRLLVVQDNKVRIMGLYGCGGVGKTTLLKQINNAFLKPTPTTSSSNSNHGFDVVILVVVSKEIDIVAIQKEIGDRLRLPSPPDTRSIFNALTKKRFVLLLDDIWERIDLESIGIPPPNENNKSKVVFTTRSEVVCGLMEANEMLKVECLPWKEAWSLFEEKVGERALNSFPRARELAEDVARECGGLPLALITIGRAMAAKKTLQEWNHAINKLRKSVSEFPGMGDQVLPRLKLSYDSLCNDTIKSCFLYCALYPEDWSIDKAELIDYWIGEGFISLSDEFNDLDDARNKGYDVIGELKGACLLESGRDEETEVKVHDTIRDLALWITHDCGNKRDKMFVIETSDHTAERWYNAERIFSIRTLHGETEEEPLKSPNLITLIYRSLDVLSLCYQKKDVVPQNFFSFMPLLRVLDLSDTKMKTFPMSITELHELRYLSLSMTPIRELPEELGKLVKLNFLDLSYMILLIKIPSGVIGSLLLELRVLNLFGSYKLDWDLDEVYNLKHLNEFGITINTQQNLNKLLSNRNLQMCTTHQNHLERIPETNMVMGIEQQHHHLGSSSYFQKLIQIKIWDCNGLKDLTWVGYVPNLNTLKVSYCKELEIIVVDDDLGGSKGGNEVVIFKSLKTLIMLHLPKLKSIICRNALAFHCLEELEVKSCPQLKKLPFDSGSNPNNTLRCIKGGPKWWSELHWEEEDHNNNNHELLKSKFLPYFVNSIYYDD